MALKYKVHITGHIVLLTGLHIGGSEVDLDIGGLDNEVAKIKVGDKLIPYIPGSSLKGKIKSLVERLPNVDIIKRNLLYGDTVNKKQGRILFRDSYLVKEDDFTLENKAENTINKATGGTTPRQMQRITKGAVFGLDVIIDIYDGDNEQAFFNLFKTGINLLKYDYLGGSGSRGYGQIDIDIPALNFTKIEFDIANGIIISDNQYNSFQKNNETQDSQNSTTTI